jgi:hypothetical protein
MSEFIIDHMAMRNTYDELMYDGFRRQGEALMLALLLVHPDIHKRIVGTVTDCTYEDSKVPLFYKRLGI